MTPTPPAVAQDVTRVTLSVAGIAVLIAGSLMVLRPFIVSLLWATMIVVSTWPFMLKVQARLGGRRGAAVASMTVILLLVLFVPLYLAFATIIEESERVIEYAHALPVLQIPPPPPWLASLPLFGRRAAERWQEFAAMPPDELAAWLAPYLKTGLSWFAEQAGTFGGMIVSFLVTVIISAVLYAKGEGAVRELRRFFRRLAGERGEAIVTLSGAAIRAVALGIVVTAMIQAVLAGIGLYGVGVPAAGFLTAVVFVFCIAQLGPILPMVPAVIWLYATGSAVRGTVLLVLMLVAQTIDNVVRPVLIKRGANLSLLLIFPGVIGGLLWLGIIGLFIGPVVLAVTSTLLDGWMSGVVAAPGSPRSGVAGGTGTA